MAIFNEMLGGGINAKDCTATSADILTGKTAAVGKEIVTGSMTNNGAVNKSLTTQNASYTIPKGYHNGSGKVTANITNLTAANIKKGVTVGGVAGTFSNGISNSIAYEYTDFTLTAPYVVTLPDSWSVIVSWYETSTSSSSTKYIAIIRSLGQYVVVGKNELVSYDSSTKFYTNASAYLKYFTLNGNTLTCSNNLSDVSTGSIYLRIRVFY